MRGSVYRGILTIPYTPRVDTISSTPNSVMEDRHKILFAVKHPKTPPAEIPANGVFRFINIPEIFPRKLFEHLL